MNVQSNLYHTGNFEEIQNIHNLSSEVLSSYHHFRVRICRIPDACYTFRWSLWRSQVSVFCVAEQTTLKLHSIDIANCAAYTVSISPTVLHTAHANTIAGTKTWNKTRASRDATPQSTGYWLEGSSSASCDDLPWRLRHYDPSKLDNILEDWTLQHRHSKSLKTCHVSASQNLTLICVRDKNCGTFDLCNCIC